MIRFVKMFSQFGWDEQDRVANLNGETIVLLSHTGFFGLSPRYNDNKEFI